MCSMRMSLAFLPAPEKTLQHPVRVPEAIAPIKTPPFCTKWRRVIMLCCCHFDVAALVSNHRCTPCRCCACKKSGADDYHGMRNLPQAAFVLLVLFTILRATPVVAAPAHGHPYLMPPAAKQRLVDHLRSNEAARKQFEAMKTRAEQGKVVEAALVFGLEGKQKAAEVVRRHLL